MEPDQRKKLVLFSDSRQDAAKLSTGIKTTHYYDTIRQIAFHEVLAVEQESVATHASQQRIYGLAQELLELQRSLLLGQALSPTDMARYAALPALLPTR